MVPLQADNCILLRMLSSARQNRYRIVRVPSYGMYLLAPTTATALPEVTPCGCDFDSSPVHCRLALPQVCPHSAAVITNPPTNMLCPTSSLPTFATSVPCSK